MRALTISQPGAQLIVEGHRDVENRAWPTRWRGPLLIHAGLQYDVLAKLPDGLDLDQHDAALESVRRGHDRRGMLVGLVQLVDVVERDPSPWAIPEHRHWKLADPIAFDTPILAGGRQGLWMPTDREIAAVHEQLAAQGVSA